MTIENDLKAAIRTIPDYPKAGIMFRDITTLLEQGKPLPEKYRFVLFGDQTKYEVYTGSVVTKVFSGETEQVIKDV